MQLTRLSEPGHEARPQLAKVGPVERHPRHEASPRPVNIRPGERFDCEMLLLSDSRDVASGQLALGDQKHRRKGRHIEVMRRGWAAMVHWRQVQCPALIHLLEAYLRSFRIPRAGR